MPNESSAPADATPRHLDATARRAPFPGPRLPNVIAKPPAPPPPRRCLPDFPTTRPADRCNRFDEDEVTRHAYDELAWKLMPHRNDGNDAMLWAAWLQRNNASRLHELSAWWRNAEVNARGSFAETLKAIRTRSGFAKAVPEDTVSDAKALASARGDMELLRDLEAFSREHGGYKDQVEAFFMILLGYVPTKIPKKTTVAA